MLSRATLIFLLALLAPITTSQAEGKNPTSINFDVIPVKVGNVTTEAQLADTQPKRAHGLMYAESAEPGMLLIYPKPRVMNLWMRNTYIPLDVAFFKPNGTIIKITQMKPLSDVVHSSGKKVIGALEMPLGWFNQHNINVGDTISY